MFSAISNNVADNASPYLAPVDTLIGLLLVFAVGNYVVLSSNAIVSSLSFLGYATRLYIVYFYTCYPKLVAMK